jgi:hypothetical protein
VRLISFAFMATLVLAHFVEDTADSLSLPLSMFRDGPAWFLGYLLFALLAAAGCLLVWSLWQSGAADDSHVYTAGLCLLLFVAVTPSDNFWHVGASFMLLGLLYLYHAALLWHAESRWFRVHLFVPLLLVALTGAHSYGLWQKGVIVYGLAALNLHHEGVRRKAGAVSERRQPRQALAARRRFVTSTVPATVPDAQYALRGWGP